ncbi:hypothetical protein ES703_89391 [subsurface metagenome]
MDEPGLIFGGGAVTNIGPSRLKVTAVGAGGDLQPLLTARSPHLNIKRLLRSEAQIGGAELLDAVEKP